ncbi:DesA family fatty acid desaturase [Sideroxydans lithotrophicus]|uniref:Fatty acid desaturase n=1 Tax=Sideroxydans lithotrophicus (strain ES-1) TaxID=580332 RepID=D5CS46_SIDLE|nr:fatty acid desaturase [Sideroxydans lithotrophicus]ADE11782.1 fatty acid desaturase [Sideroxydans lithotrophicus ES-1]
MQFNLLHLAWWGDVLVTLMLTHITIAAVTIYLHRHQSHRSLELHPLTSHFFRFWLWLTTGQVTREWVAIHRKHHVMCETADDPHSPNVYGIYGVLFGGSELYRKEAKNIATLETYGHGTPDDWIERHVYTKHQYFGIAIMLVVDVVLFGPIGITIWAVQMLWIPFFAAGVINGAGHYWGYRSFVTNDTSCNIVGWGVLIGGEELHNNHHAYSASAKLSVRWWEFDIGWMYIRVLSILRLARVRKIAPRLIIDPAKVQCDTETLQSIVYHHYEVMGRFARSLRETAINEVRRLLSTHAIQAKKARGMRGAIKHWLKLDENYLPEKERLALMQAVQSSTVFQTIYTMRQELAALANRSHESRELLVQQLESWCRRAEESGINALREFSLQLRSYSH